MGTPAFNPASLSTTIILIGVVGLIAWVVFVIIRVRRAARRARADQKIRAYRCVCGYSFAGLDVPRCPECGRAAGFNKTFDELGVSEQEVIEHVRKRSEELRDKPLPEEARVALRVLDEMEQKIRVGQLPADVMESLRSSKAAEKK